MKDLLDDKTEPKTEPKAETKTETKTESKKKEKLYEVYYKGITTYDVFLDGFLITFPSDEKVYIKEEHLSKFKNQELFMIR